MRESLIYGDLQALYLNSFSSLDLKFSYCFYIDSVFGAHAENLITHLHTKGTGAFSLIHFFVQMFSDFSPIVQARRQQN